MHRKRFTAALLVIMLLGCSFVPVAAAGPPASDIIMPLATGQLNHNVPANSIIAITQELGYSKGDTITYNCTYSPKSASLDFGYLDSDNVFHYVNCTSGSIYKTIKIEKAGQYTLAICNNESYAVTVTGTVKY